MDTGNIINLIGRIREKANRFIIAELGNCGIYGLSPTHGGILVHLLKYGEVPIKELPQLIDRDKSTVSALVKKLYMLGYIERRTDVDDNRTTLISLTAKGKKMEPIINEISGKLIEKIYVNVSRKEQEEVVKILKKLNDSW